MEKRKFAISSNKPIKLCPHSSQRVQLPGLRAHFWTCEWAAFVFFSYSLKHLFLVWAMPFIANIHNIWNASSKVSVGMRSHDCDSFTIDTQTHTAYCCITLATPLSACLSIRFVSNDLKKNSCCNFTEWERSFGCCEDGRTFELNSETIFETITS